MDVYHSDAGMLSESADLGRPVSLHQALGSRSEAESEGLNIRLRRLTLRMTQSEFARRAGISRGQLSRIEHGHVKIEALTRSKIAFAFRSSRFRNRNAQMATPKTGAARRLPEGKPRSHKPSIQFPKTIF
ncbi:MAG: helix-turn-helix domain-containing protein [Bdellovibrionales bacterium]|nr:helix-turn-helix domain-containing protein [Bdellovibrionales bacterium]